MAKYTVYGDYGLGSECLLEEFDTYAEAERFVDGYARSGDMGGWETVEVIQFAKDGEAITNYIIGRSDFEAFGDEDDWAFDEGDDDFALIDEF